MFFKRRESFFLDLDKKRPRMGQKAALRPRCSDPRVRPQPQQPCARHPPRPAQRRNQSLKAAPAAVGGTRGSAKPMLTTAEADRRRGAGNLQEARPPRASATFDPECLNPANAIASRRHRSGANLAGFKAWPPTCSRAEFCLLASRRRQAAINRACQTAAVADAQDGVPQATGSHPAASRLPLFMPVQPPQGRSPAGSTGGGPFWVSLSLGCSDSAAGQQQVSCSSWASPGRRVVASSRSSGSRVARRVAGPSCRSASRAALFRRRAAAARVARTAPPPHTIACCRSRLRALQCATLRAACSGVKRSDAQPHRPCAAATSRIQPWAGPPASSSGGRDGRGCSTAGARCRGCSSTATAPAGLWPRPVDPVGGYQPSRAVHSRPAAVEQGQLLAAPQPQHLRR